MARMAAGCADVVAAWSAAVIRAAADAARALGLLIVALVAVCIVAIAADDADELEGEE